MVKFTISNLDFSTSAGDLNTIYCRLCTVGVDSVFGVMEHKFDFFSSKEALDEFQKEYHIWLVCIFFNGSYRLYYDCYGCHCIKA